jgi:hypothetical protein
VGRYTFYSKDLYGWSGTYINHNLIEKQTIFVNTGGLPVFENDVIRYSNGHSIRYLHCKASQTGEIQFFDLLNDTYVSISNIDSFKNQKVIFAGSNASNTNRTLLKAMLRLDM